MKDSESHSVAASRSQEDNRQFRQPAIPTHLVQAQLLIETPLACDRRSKVTSPNVEIRLVNLLVARAIGRKRRRRAKRLSPHDVVGGVHTIVVIVVARQKRRRVDGECRRYHLRVIEHAVVEHNQKRIGRPVLIRGKPRKKTIGAGRRRRGLAQRVRNQMVVKALSLASGSAIWSGGGSAPSVGESVTFTLRRFTNLKWVRGGRGRHALRRRIPIPKRAITSTGLEIATGRDITSRNRPLCSSIPKISYPGICQIIDSPKPGRFTSPNGSPVF